MQLAVKMAEWKTLLQCQENLEYGSCRKSCALSAYELVCVSDDNYFFHAVYLFALVIITQR